MLRATCKVPRVTLDPLQPERESNVGHFLPAPRAAQLPREQGGDTAPIQYWVCLVPCRDTTLGPHGRLPPSKPTKEQPSREQFLS